MSLRVRLFASMAFVLFVSLTLGGLLIWWHATQSVRTEMDAAFAVAEQSVGNAIDHLPESGDPGGDLKKIIATFDGDRHVRAALADDHGTVIAASSLAPAPTVPQWFLNLIGVTARIAQIPHPVGPGATDIVTLRTDPENEIGEVWDDLRDNVEVMALFCVLAFPLVYWIVGRTLLPLRTLANAFPSLGSGDYTAHVGEEGPPELIQLAQGFNRMVERLASVEARNRQLHEQLMTLQEEERADLARDLHDEVGPFLFAVNVDATTIPRLAETGRHAEIQERVRSIRNSVGHIQKHVKAILGRLRPVGLVEFGLRQAMESLAAFWRSRHDDIAIAVDVAVDGDSFGEVLDETIYRIVQESLSNAVRHGRPTEIAIVIAEDRSGDIRVTVSDNGVGLEKPTRNSGFGLIGMSERVAAVGGTISVANRTGSPGVIVAARLPRDAAANTERQALSA